MALNDSAPSGANRRRFIGAALATAASYSRVLGANERLRLGLIGCGDRGRYDMRNFIKAGVDVVALCDVWEDAIGKAREFPGLMKTVDGNTSGIAPENASGLEQPNTALLAPEVGDQV